MPSRAELNVLFNNRAAIGGFNMDGHCDEVQYWSSTQYDAWGACSQSFSNGAENYDSKLDPSSVRLVRTGP